MISSLAKISMIPLLSSLSLKLYLNSLVYHRNIFSFSSKVFGNLWKSLEILGKCPRTFIWPLEQVWKVFGNLQKIIQKTIITEVKMAGYWPSSFFACLWTETKSRSINSQKKNEVNIQSS